MLLLLLLLVVVVVVVSVLLLLSDVFLSRIVMSVARYASTTTTVFTHPLQINSTIHLSVGL